MVMQFYHKNNIPWHLAGWETWRKTSLTSMLRIATPFTITTSEGPLTCKDGYLAIDARGNPYPIAAEEHAKIYEKA